MLKRSNVAVIYTALSLPSALFEFRRTTPTGKLFEENHVISFAQFSCLLVKILAYQPSNSSINYCIVCQTELVLLKYWMKQWIPEMSNLSRIILVYLQLSRGVLNIFHSSYILPLHIWRWMTKMAEIWHATKEPVPIFHKPANFAET